MLNINSMDFVIKIPKTKDGSSDKEHFSYPQRHFKNEEFSRFTFTVSYRFAKKNEDDEWYNKYLNFNCIIWNEKLADKFEEQFIDKEGYNNQICLSGIITDIYEESYTVSTDYGKKERKAIKNLTLQVNSLKIIVEKFEKKKKEDNQDILEQEREPAITDDEIPF